MLVNIESGRKDSALFLVFGHSNRLEGAKGSTGGWSRHVMVYWSTNCQKSMLYSVFGQMVCRQEAFVERTQSFVVTRISCLGAQRSLGRQEERYVVLIRFCSSPVCCYNACNELRHVRFPKPSIPY